MLKANFYITPAGDYRYQPGVLLRLTSDDANSREIIDYIRVNLLLSLEGMTVEGTPIATKITVGYTWGTAIGATTVASVDININETNLAVAKQISDVVINKAKELYENYLNFISEFNTYFGSGEIILSGNTESGENGNDSSEGEGGGQN